MMVSPEVDLVADFSLDVPNPFISALQPSTPNPNPNPNPIINQD